jgi:hypothetical protein
VVSVVTWYSNVPDLVLVTATNIIIIKSKAYPYNDNHLPEYGIQPTPETLFLSLYYTLDNVYPVQQKSSRRNIVSPSPRSAVEHMGRLFGRVININSRSSPN